MLVGVVGLGLIGGSFAKAYSEEGHTVAAFDVNEEVMKEAMEEGAVNMELTDEVIPDCDLILVCTYPNAAIKYMEEKGPLFGSKPVVIDCCGTKRKPVAAGLAAARKYNFTYVGGHPMAGTHHSGFKYARGDMYEGAPMVIVPPAFATFAMLEHVKELLDPVGFAMITVTSAEKHDSMIAFTSQLAHIVSSAYIKSDTALDHKGFSAGSYKDMTRVAWLNPEMWAELFLDNDDNLIKEIDILIKNLDDYKNAIAAKDRDLLVKLLDEGKRRKEEVDG